MKKWTVLASIMLAACLGGLFWFFMQQRQEVPPTGEALPETDVPPDEFETEKDLGDTDTLLEDSEEGDSQGLKDQDYLGGSESNTPASPSPNSSAPSGDNSSNDDEPLVIEDDGQGR